MLLLAHARSGKAGKMFVARRVVRRTVVGTAIVGAAVVSSASNAAEVRPGGRGVDGVGGHAHC